MIEEEAPTIEEGVPTIEEDAPTIDDCDHTIKERAFVMDNGLPVVDCWGWER